MVILGQGRTASHIAATFKVAEVRAPTTGVSWLADVEECAEATLQLQLRAQPEDLPQWEEGSPVDCTLSGGRDRVCAVTTVLRQSEQTLWLRVPAAWLSQDRRASRRRPGGFGVSCLTDGPERAAASGECVDITEAGMCLAMSQPVALRQVIDLLFRLPGDTRPTCASGTVAWVGPPAGRGRIRAGIAFTHVLRDSRERILDYCRRTEAA